MVEIRNRIQQEAFDAWNTGGRKSIIKAAPRTGKTRIASKAILDYSHVVIIVPRLDIVDGWQDTFYQLWQEKSPSRVDYITTRGIKKLGLGSSNTLYIMDEIHEYSDNQLADLQDISENPNIDIIALTGTLTKKKEERILRKLGLPISYEYSIEEAVRDGILTDYEINIHKVPLDRYNRIIKSKRGNISEKQYFDNISYVIKHLSKNKAFLEKKLIQVLQTSRSKLKATLSLLDRYKDERVLVFCGQTKIADQLGIPVYHSKTKEKEILNSFCKNLGVNQLATVKMLQAGITIYPIDRGILNYTSGSPETCTQMIARFLAYEWNKKAKLDILCADEAFETGRITTALQYMDPLKINYI